MHIESGMKGIAVEMATIADPALKAYVKRHGRPIPGSGGSRVRLTWAEWARRPGVKSKQALAEDRRTARTTALRDGPEPRRGWPKENWITGVCEYAEGARDDA